METETLQVSTIESERVDRTPLEALEFEWQDHPSFDLDCLASESYVPFGDAPEIQYN